MFHSWTYQLLSLSLAVLSLLRWTSFEQLFAIVSHDGIGVIARPSAVDGGTGGGHLNIEITSKELRLLMNNYTNIYKKLKIKRIIAYRCSEDLMRFSGKGNGV